MAEEITVGKSTVTTGLDRSLVNVGAQLTPVIQKMYSIFLWNIETNEVVQDNTLDPSKTRPAAEYFFTTPPKQAEMAEPWTTRVIATQNGGKFIESHGSIFKEIRVQGTTGLRPNKKLPNSIPLLQTESFQNLAQTVTGGLNNEVRTLPKDEVTGFDDIHFLRNIFRRYSDSQSRPERIVMVWRNIKDNDYWVVEPKDFRLTVDAQSPLTYQYQINMQGLAPFNGDRPQIPNDPLKAIRSIQRFTSRISEIKQDLTSSFLVLATQVNRIQGAGYFGINNTLGTMTGVIRGLNSVFSGIQSIDDNLLRSVDQADTEFQEAIDALKDTLEGEDDNGVQLRDAIIRAFRKARRSFARIKTEPTLRASARRAENTARRSAENAYRTSSPGGGAPSFPRSGGSPSFLGNTSSPSTVAEGVVNLGDTIRDLSKRYLGDARRWHELVLLNDLRAPFTTDGESRPGVLVPGDRFLYPSTAASTDPLGINPQSSVDEQGGDLDNPNSLISQTYGRDLRLVSVESAGDIDATDIAVSQRGDLATIVGVPNVQQAIRLKFLTEQGELAQHPRYGARFPIGNKADRFSFNTFRINTLATLRSDPRVAEVVDLNFQAIEDLLLVDSTLLLTDGRDPIETNFELRRF